MCVGSVIWSHPVPGISAREGMRLNVDLWNLFYEFGLS